MRTRLTDLHCHPIPGVDDGAASWEASAAMLHEAFDSAHGDLTLIATPHVRMGASRGRGFLGRRTAEFAVFARREVPGLRVGFGAEVLLDGMANRSRAAALPTYPGSEWVLVELPQRLAWPFSLLRLLSLSRFRTGILLAHPERYPWCARRPGRLAGLRKAGVRCQVSGRSLERGGRAVRDTAFGLMADGLCDIFASDCHAPGNGTLASFEDEICARAGRRGWEAMTCGNPAAILENSGLPSGGMD